MPGYHVRQIESKLAVAHRALWTAAQFAETMKDQGLADDLFQLTAEVGKLNTAMINGDSPQKLRAATERI
jgi:hypothetical protein